MVNQSVGAVLCAFSFMLFMIPIAIFGTRHRIREAEEIINNANAGHYSYLSHGKSASRIRIFSVVQLMILGLLGIMMAIMINKSPIIREPGFVISFFGIIALDLITIVLFRRSILYRKK